jgi:glycosyltransferase involved in cell wall biosynthesis
MHIIFFTHPEFLGHQSIPRFAKMLAGGMQQRGHTTEIWAPEALFYNFPLSAGFKKWMGYIDQYIVFPAQVRKKLNSCPPDTLFVFTDQALGPWIPLVAKRHHVIHCHDFLAQRSALDEISENPTSATGKKYQAYIRRGYQRGKNFISVSRKTQSDLHRFLGFVPETSEVVYNGLNRAFQAYDYKAARTMVSNEINMDVASGYLLHIGGNQWYKNRVGLIKMYNCWRNTSDAKLPLLMVGSAADATLLDAYNSSPFKDQIHLLEGKSDDFVRYAYNGASVFIFPSLAEGFGWPIAEAMASGCPVITTNDDPMSEVGGDAAFYIPHPDDCIDSLSWAKSSASIIEKVINLNAGDRKHIIDAGIANAERFDTTVALNKIENIYKAIVAK